MTDYQDVNAMIEYSKATSNDWSSLPVIIANGMLAFATDTKEFRIGNGVSGYASLPVAFNLSDVTDIDELISRFPELTPADAGRLLIVNDDGTGYVLSDVRLTELAASEDVTVTLAGYSRTDHTHAGTYVTKAQIDALMGAAPVDGGNLSGQDTLSYVVLSKLQRDIDTQVTLPDGYADEFTDTYGLDLALSKGYTAAGDSLVSEGEWAKLADGPSIRYHHSAVAIDGKMYVHGGHDGSTLLKDTYVYDPSTNLWTKLADGPGVRAYHSAVAIDGKMYVHGGANGSLSTDLYVYDPTTNLWTQLADAPIAKYIHSAVAIDGKMYVHGENNSIGTYYRDLYVYDPSTNLWTKLANAPVGRIYHSAVAIGSKMYVHGGNGASSTPLKDLYVYDPTTNLWAKLADGPIVRAFHSAVAIDGKMYVHGGTSNSVPLNDIYVYDPSTNVWTKLSDAPVARLYHSAVAIDGNLYVHGGDGGSIPLQDTYSLVVIGNANNLLLVSTSTSNPTDIEEAYLFLRAQSLGTINKDTCIEMTRDGDNWAVADMKESIMSGTDIKVYTGSTAFDKAITTTSLDLSTATIQDHKGSVTTLVVDVANTSGHVDSALAADLVGASIQTASGNVAITTITNTGTGSNELKFAGLMPVGTYAISKIVKLSVISTDIVPYANAAGQQTTTIPIPSAKTLTVKVTSAATVFCAVALIADASVYSIYVNSSWIPIVRRTDSIWEYRTAINNWAASPINSAEAALSKAIISSNNQMSISTLPSLDLQNLTVARLAISQNTPISTISDIIVTAIEPVVLPAGSDIKYRIRVLNDTIISSIHGLRINWK